MSKKDDDKLISKVELYKRGWDDELIAKYLPQEHSLGGWYESTVLYAEQFDKTDYKKKRDFRNVRKEQRRQIDREKTMQKKELQRQVAKSVSIQNPAEDYPLARKIHRHFIINVGETNTGKTYTALQALKAADSGVYLSPLRLLAMEVQDTLMEDGCLCSMTTGEEENIVPNATIMSSTVEKICLTQHYSVGVIDECQMIADRDRGGAWTRAILGLCADTIYLCMSENALSICIKLIEMCEDTYEVKKCERTSPLIMSNRRVKPEDLQKGDAIILFSRKEVLRYAKTLESLGRKVSIIYGALPYEARKHQVELYRKGKTDIVVATDAIGMGLNLPIKRIIFGAMSKFDGTIVRQLEHHEIKQIAGRAGRRGIYDEGIVSVFTEGDATLKYIKEGLEKRYGQIAKITIPFPEECVRGDMKVSEAMKIWKNIQYPHIFASENLQERLVKVDYLEKSKWNLSAEQILSLSKVVFDTDNYVLFETYKNYVAKSCQGINIEMPKIKGNEILSELEMLHKHLQLYYSFHNVLGLPIDIVELNRTKERLIKLLNKELEKEKKTKEINLCCYCHCALPPFFKFRICKDCYNSWHKLYDY